MKAYQDLVSRFREAARIKSIQSILGWDQETFLPDKAAPWRGDQLAWLAGTHHRLVTAPEIEAALAACEDHGFPDDSPEAVNVRGWRRDYRLATRLPAEFVEELSRTTAKATHVWADARRRSDFAAYQPMLEQLVSLTKQKADLLGWEACRYDALVDEYEPGARTADLTALFASLAPEIAALVGPATEVSARTPADLLAGHYPIAAQQAFNRQVAEAFGFDFTAGRIDTTTHPFCTSLGPCDTRLTTRYDEADFLSSFYGVLHEAGHGLYEQGLDKEHWGLPAGDACSLGIHESQSRLWENHIGGSTAFWQHWLPRAATHFPHLAALAPEQVAAAARRVAPGFIRVDADEVTYDLHIILRFEIETALIGDQLAVADLPAAWNARFRELTDLTVPDDARGCLQDIHWSFAGFGYFATYTLGNLNASQLMHAARRDVVDLDASLAAGHYAPLLGWLRSHVHAHGRRWSAPDLMRHATGAPTTAEHHLAYLRSRFLA